MVIACLAPIVPRTLLLLECLRHLQFDRGFWEETAQMVLDTHDPLKGEMVQMLATDGTYTGPDEPPLDDAQVRRIYEDMMTMRIYDRKAVSLQRQGRFGTYAQMEGQEASLIGSHRIAHRDQPADHFPLGNTLTHIRKAKLERHRQSTPHRSLKTSSHG